jgi:lipopolysaccharide export system protein LptA
MNFMNRIVSILFLTILSFTAAQGQALAPDVQDTSRNEQVIVDHADLFEYIQMEDSVMQRLIGNVELRQDSVNFYCDSAFIINEVDVIAMGNVVIQQGDSLTVFADSLAYEGEERIADLFGEVILASGNQRLFTNRLNYDLNQKLATYESGAVLTNDTTQLTSKRGYYYVDLDEIYFKDSVQIIDPNFELKSDTLKYNTTDQIATFLAPTLIVQNDSKIYCEGGFYDIANQMAVFKENPQYLKDETKATADTIRYFGQEREVVLEGNALFLEGEKRAEADLLRYFEETEITVLQGNALYKDEGQFITSDTITYDQRNNIYATRGRSLVSDPPQLIEADQLDYDRKQGQGLALGNVIWRDTSSELTIICEVANYDEQTDYLKASGGRANKPLLITKVEGDSLFLTSDTLIAFRPDSLQNDSSRILLAFNDVRIYKNNLQALCDSLVYSSLDSMFRLYQSPMIWSDTSQFSADTIHMQLAEGKIDRILLFNKSFIINTPDEQFFNQVKGKYVTAFFESEEIRRMEVKGNAESVYYAIDEENAYIGANQTVCSEMTLFFGNNQVEEIRFFTQPQGSFTPMRDATGSKSRLTGFRWAFEKAPQSLDDLFLTDKQ